MSEPERWLDRPHNVTRLVRGLYAACAALLLTDLVHPRETHFAFEAWIGFFAVFGFAAYTGIVMSAKLLRRLVRRPENYYDATDGTERRDD